MIACHLPASGAKPLPAARLARSLEHSSRRIACGWAVADTAFAHLLPVDTPPPKGQPQTGNITALINGWIGNQDELCETLGLAPSTPNCALYAAAIGRWGDTADNYIKGHYCAIAWCHDETRLRLARSPFQAPPLHFRAAPNGIIASPLIRSLWLGDEDGALSERELDLVKLAALAAGDGSDQSRGWYPHCRQVPLGMAVELSLQGGKTAERTIWRYDLFACPQIRFPRDEDYVEAALELFDQGVAGVLQGMKAPAAMVSGGLDSPMVAASALRQMPAGTPLHGYTYAPESDWQGAVADGVIADESAIAVRFAAMHPGLVHRVLRNDGEDFRHHISELIRAMDCAPPSLPLVFPLHSACDDAKLAGCDVMLTGDLGNDGFSSSAPWAHNEYFRSFRWRQLALALRKNHADPRSMFRRFLALVAAPMLPGPIWQIASRMAHGPQIDHLVVRGLNRDWADRQELTLRPALAHHRTGRYDTATRKAAWQHIMAHGDYELAEAYQGFEQIYGITCRDPTAYRPLMEFCWGIPTDQFMRDGTDRWLARRMAKGRLPEEQRQLRDHGLTGADTYHRIRRIRHELRAQVERMEDDPDMAAMLDLPALAARLDHMPETPPPGDCADHPYKIGIPLAFSAAYMIAHAKGRNDF